MTHRHLKIIFLNVIGLYFLTCSQTWLSGMVSTELAVHPLQKAVHHEEPLLQYYDLVLIIPTISHARRRRDFIRKQFPRNANLTSATALLLFIMSDEEVSKKQVEAEVLETEDIVFVSCRDVDSGMPEEDSSTTCKVLQAIQYVYQRYTFSYLARVGDDAYFRFDYFWSHVRPLLPEGPSYTGRFLMNGQVWEPHLQKHLGLNFYPPYTSGMGYVFSHDVAKYIAVASKLISFRTGYPEDAVVGLWLVGINLARYHTLDFHNPLGAQYMAKECTNESILIHYMTEQLWKAIDSNGLLYCG